MTNSVGDSLFSDVTGAGAVGLSSGGAMTFHSVASSAGGVTLTTAGTLTGSSVTAAQAIALTAGSAQLSTATAGAALTAFATGDLVLTTATAGALITLTTGGNLRLGTATASGDITLTSAAGSGAAAVAGNGSVTVVSASSSGGNLTLTAAKAITAGPLRAGLAVRGRGASFGLSAPMLVIEAHSQNITIGDLPIGAATAATSLAVQTLGRIDILGRLVASGSVAGRSLSFGGDGSVAGQASVIRIAATSAGGGRLERADLSSKHGVIPAKAGTHLRHDPEMGPRLRGDDGLVKTRPALWHGWGALAGERPWAMAGIGLAVGMAGLALGTTIDGLVPPLLHHAGSGGVVGLLGGTLLILFQASVEEVYFRGWLQPVLSRAWGRLAGLLVSAAAFAGLHLLGGDRTAVTLLNLLLGGLLFGLLAQRSGGIVAAAAAHFAWNWAEAIGLGLARIPASATSAR